jgi:hypothetical protein
MLFKEPAELLKEITVKCPAFVCGTSSWNVLYLHCPLAHVAVGWPQGRACDCDAALHLLSLWGKGE